MAKTCRMSIDPAGMQVHLMVPSKTARGQLVTACGTSTERWTTNHRRVPWEKARPRCPVCKQRVLDVLKSEQTPEAIYDEGSLDHDED